MGNSYMVMAQSNLAVCEDLKEVHAFLQDLKGRGITYAKVIGSKQDVRLTESGHWVWVENKHRAQR